MVNSSKGSVMRTAAPNTNSPFRTRPKHVKLSQCPIEISPQHRTNSLDANVAHHSVLQHISLVSGVNHVEIILELFGKPRSFFLLYFVKFFLKLSVLIEKMEPKRVQMQDTAIIQYEMPTTPEK